jgi:putative transposase
LGVRRTSVYEKKKGKKPDNLKLEELIMKTYLRFPFYGYRRIREDLIEQGHNVNRKRVRRIMHDLGIRAIYPKRNLSIPNKQHKKYPYLLRGLRIEHVNQVWASDITYIRLKQGVIYLVAIIDIFSRKVLSWKLSNTLDRNFCIEALNEALCKYGKPEIFNTDQGSQFTSIEFTQVLLKHNIRISMNGKGRALDNVFMERTFRSLKYEEVYLNEYDNISECRNFIDSYFTFYNQRRKHQSLKYKTPDAVFHENIQNMKVG